MEKIWKWLADTANKELTKRELKRRTAGIYNRLDELAGQVATAIDAQALGLRTQIAEEISDQFATAGPLIVQQLNGHLNKVNSDNITVIRDMLDEQTKHSERCGDRNNTLLASIMGRAIVMLNTLTSKSEKRQNYIMEAFNELARQAAVHDQSNTDRNVTLVAMIQQLNAKIDHNNNMQQAMQVKFFENLSLQIQMATANGKERYSPAPNLEWLMDNYDHLRDFVNATELTRNNDTPRSTGVMRAVSAVRSMDYFTGASNVRKEVERLFTALDNDQQLCAAA